MSFQSIKPKQIPFNVFQLVKNEHLLIAVGPKTKYNMMTASSGGMGIIADRPVCFLVIHSTRYTMEFLEANDTFSINVLPTTLRNILKYCGSKSGREVDKMDLKDLTAVEEHKTVYFQESSLVFLCKKFYFHDIDPNHLLDSKIQFLYKRLMKNNYYRMYNGMILKVYAKSDSNL